MLSKLLAHRQQQAQKALFEIHRVPLAHLPTPLEKMDRFGSLYGLSNLWIKRDDCTGLAMGGNKARKLEFLVADALDKKAEVLFTLGGVQSNHARMTAAAACRYGFDCHLWLLGDKPNGLPGNLLLDTMLGASVDFMPNMNDAELQKNIDDYLDSQRKQGKRPYYIPIGGGTGLGSMGYVAMIQELSQQLKEKNLEIKTIVTALGSGGTMAGLVLGCKLFMPQTRVLGISVSRTTGYFHGRVLEVIREGETVLGLDPVDYSDDLFIYDQYLGECYGKPTPEGLEAINKLALSEGILIDPVYTGKAMAGLVDLARQGTIAADEPVLFIHTGGVPAIFAFENLFHLK